MSDLGTKYLGHGLRSPLVASSSPLCEDVSNIKRMEDAGAGAVVLHSLFEEQLAEESAALDRYLVQGSESHAEALSYFPDMGGYNLGPDGYLEHIRQAKAVVGIPIIASLNGVSRGGWTSFARQIEQAGADALELNIYYIPTDPRMTSPTIEQMYVDLVAEVRAAVKIPLAVKLSPYFSGVAGVAKQLCDAGANGLVLFNRFYQPDFDLEALEVVPSLALSTSEELRLRLCWAAILCDRVPVDLAITGGVHTAEDVVKSMMAGAKVAMMASALLQRGIGELAAVRANLLEWMERHEYHSIRQMQGSMSQRKVSEPAAFLRANYMEVLRSYSGKLRV